MTQTEWPQKEGWYWCRTKWRGDSNWRVSVLRVKQGVGSLFYIIDGGFVYPTEYVAAEFIETEVPEQFKECNESKRSDTDVS